MIIGTGVDMVDINRIERLLNRNGDRFLKRCFTPYEREQGNSITNQRQRAAYFAKRFAAKEAYVKAIGTGFREGLGWKDICVQRSDLGRPYFEFTAKAQAKLKTLPNLGKDEVAHLSLSDERDTALAWVIIETR